MAVRHVPVTCGQVAAARLQVELERREGREPDPVLVKLAEAGTSLRLGGGDGPLLGNGITGSSNTGIEAPTSTEDKPRLR